MGEVFENVWNTWADSIGKRGVVTIREDRAFFWNAAIEARDAQFRKSLIEAAGMTEQEADGVMQGVPPLTEED